MKIAIYFEAKWQFKDHTNYKITTCKKVINTKTNRIIKGTKNGGSVGFFIAGKFYKKSDINRHIEVIPKKEWMPF